MSVAREVDAEVVPSVEDELAEREEAVNDWADALVAALAGQARRQVARDAAHAAGVCDLYDLIASGVATGRCARTERAIVARIRDAVRGGGPRQGRLALAVPLRPRAPSRRGRPMGWGNGGGDVGGGDQGVLL